MASDGDGPSPLISTWTVMQGPGAVAFTPNGTSAAAHATATFSAPGTYLLQVAVSDGLSTTTATTTVQVVAPGLGHGVTGRYYPDLTLAGVPVTRLDGPIDFDWGGGAPVDGIGADQFSVSWVGEVEPLTTESYTFVTESDDGVRLWIDGHIVIDDWTDHGPTIDRGIALPMIAGTRHEVRMEYFEHTGGAVARLRWSTALLGEQAIPVTQLFDTVQGTGTGLIAAYFPTMTLSGTAVPRLDSMIDFGWGTGAPITGIGSDNFSARWVGQVAAHSTDTYTFSTISDDGIRVWLDGTLLIDNWTSHAPTTDTAVPVTLLAGDRHDLRVEYFENTGGATVRLRWATATSAAAAVPMLQLYPQPPPAAGSGTGLTAAYYATMDLSGPAITRTDTVIDFDWGTGAPMAGIGSDNFSVRWVGQVAAPTTDTYTFSTISDDGIRVWLDGTLLIDNWTTHAPTTDTAIPVALLAGELHDLRVEYFENAGGATVRLHWATATSAAAVVPMLQLYPQPVPAIGSGTGLTAAYYATIDLSGPAITRFDPVIDFDWGTGAPITGIGSDNFSVRWVGQVAAPTTDTYTFSTISDDGIRVWLDGALVIDNWTNHSPTTNTAVPVTLLAGDLHDLRVEYFENTGGATVRLLWSTPTRGLTVIPVTQLYPALVGVGRVDLRRPEVNTGTIVFSARIH